MSTNCNSSDPPECAIPMCGGTGKLIPCCENGHFMHADCAKLMVENVCPLCRSVFADSLMKSFINRSSLACMLPPTQAGACFVYATALEDIDNQKTMRSFVK